jgi:hypothetical protein
LKATCGVIPISGCGYIADGRRDLRAKRRSTDE